MDITEDVLLPTPKDVKELIPVLEPEKSFIHESKLTLERIVSREDKRKLFIIGPCSIHNPTAFIEYAHVVSGWQKQFSDKFIFVLRAHFEKSRSGLGWKGFAYDPSLDGSSDLMMGLLRTRKLLIETLKQTKLPMSAEIVDPLVFAYFKDLLNWATVGARTAYSQVHRQYASSLAIPVGFKNAIDGCLKNSMVSMAAARYGHTFYGVSEKGKMVRKSTSGNRLTHLILRGSFEGPNYHPEDIRELQELMKAPSSNTSLIIDCGHGNASMKRQDVVFKEVFSYFKSMNQAIMGYMLESNIKGGSQPLSTNADKDRSVTDDCLSISETYELIKWAYDHDSVSPPSQDQTQLVQTTEGVYTQT